MEFPSMVERSGDHLVIRSLVSGTPVYQTPLDSVDGLQPLMEVDILERQLEQFKMSSMVMPSLALSSVPLTASHTVPGKESPDSATLTEGNPVINEEDLPQCKIRRNYSCNQCAFFTQNPRSHLSHLRDVHGERIVINECKLCLYASRHFQKLVRHMKMVHGCSDDGGTSGSSGQMKGKRNLSREARKRRLEESIEVPTASASGLDPSLVKMLQNGPSLEKLKAELHHQEQLLLSNVQAYNRQLEVQQLQQIVESHDNIFSMAFEYQLKLMPPKQQGATGKSDGNSSTDSEEAPQSPTPDVLELPPGVEQFQCHKCSYSTPIRARFKKHVKYHSMPLIKCSSCDFHTPYKWNLDRHTKNHGAHGHFKCSVCDFSTDIKQSLTIHELNHHVPTVGHQMAARRRAPEEQEYQVGDQQAIMSKKIEMEKVTPSVATLEAPLQEVSGLNCTYCQQRVANSIDLFKHLQKCSLAIKGPSQNLAATTSGDNDITEDDLPSASSDLSYCGVETAPGYGEVTDQFLPDDADDMTPLKKVFKCPHCTFWAATASRFHVHIVGHLNRKPFECSLCAYRSNWRWDITKHIRLKAIRDKSHNHAQVLMNDETGRRNYAKYNQYLTLMKVNVDQLGDAKAMRTGDMIVVPPEKLDEQMGGPTEKFDKEAIATCPQVFLDALKCPQADPVDILDCDEYTNDSPMETAQQKQTDFEEAGSPDNGSLKIMAANKESPLDLERQ